MTPVEFMPIIYMGKSIGYAMTIFPKPIALNDQNMLDVVRRIAKDSANIVWTQHSKQRMQERKITTSQVMKVLHRGFIKESVYQTPSGDWKCTMSHVIAADEISVALAVRWDASSLIVIITVY